MFFNQLSPQSCKNELPVKAVPRYRNEWKFFCSDGQMEILKNALKGILYPDPHMGLAGN